jgi:hypothetical protein
MVEFCEGENNFLMGIYFRFNLLYMIRYALVFRVALGC